MSGHTIFFIIALAVLMIATIFVTAYVIHDDWKNRDK